MDNVPYIDDGDEIIATDETTGITYVFRGGKRYELVDGKEVLIDYDANKKRTKDTSDRPRK